MKFMMLVIPAEGYGDILWAVEAEFDGCGSTLSPVSAFTTSANAACAPAAQPPREARSSRP